MHFQKIRWKGGTWATEETLDVDGPYHVTLGFGLGLRLDGSRHRHTLHECMSDFRRRDPGQCWNRIFGSRVNDFGRVGSGRVTGQCDRPGV